MNQVKPDLDNEKLLKKIEMLDLKKSRCNRFIPQSLICNCELELYQHDDECIENYFQENLLNLRTRDSYFADLSASHQIKSRNKPSKKCSNFLPKDGRLLRCGCGRIFEDHDLTVINSFIDKKFKETEKEWKEFKEGFTIDNGPTDAYGDLVFLGLEKRAKYVKLSHNTAKDKIINLLFSKSLWNIKQPGLIISVTGGTNLDISQTFKDHFCKGLVKAALNTNAIITSGGCNMGCMKLVGEAFKETSFSSKLNDAKNVAVLGFSSWTTIRGNETLLNSNRDDLNEAAEYEIMLPKKSQEEKSAHLDPNHGYFILVDAVKLNEFGGEIKLRSNLESEMLKKGIPIVVLVLGGGRNTVVTVLEQVKNNIPCVFFYDTGKFSSVFGFIQNKIDKNEEIFKSVPNKNDSKLYFDDEFRDLIRDKIIFEMRKENVKTNFQPKDEIINPIITNLEEIFQLKYQHLLSFFKLKTNEIKNSVDVAILNALLKSFKKKESLYRPLSINQISPEQRLQEKKNFRNQIELCLKWNRFDLAKNYIFIDRNKDKIGSIEEFMYYSIRNNRHQFVKLFLENGFVIRNFLTYRKLIKLYNYVQKTNDLYKLLNRESRIEKLNDIRNELPNFSAMMNFKKKRRFNERTFSFKNIGSAIEILIDYFYQHKFCMIPFSCLSQYQCEKILEDTDKFGKAKEKTIGIFNGLDKSTELDVDRKCDQPEFELFLYSVLLGWPEMALVFWSVGNNSICLALFASKIFKKYANLFDVKRSFYIKMADDFENLAVGILNMCTDQDQDKIEQLLIRQIPELGNRTALQIAVAADAFNFISHICCQRLLTKLWFNKLIIDSPTPELYLSLLVPFAAPFLLDFGTNKPNSIFYSNQESQIFKDYSSESSDDELNEDTNKKPDKSWIDGFENSAILLTQKRTKKPEEDVLEYIHLIYLFLKAPFTRFVYHQIFYLMFLFLYSYVILCNFYMINENKNFYSTLGLSISIPEVVLIIWVIAYLFEEIRKFVINETFGIKARLKNHLNQIWNLISLVSIFLFLIGIILRFIPNSNCLLAARIILCIDILFWYTKMLQAYWFIRSLGPMLVLIERMSVQVLLFLTILVLFIFSFGIAIQSLMYPNQDLNKNLLKNIFFPSFFVIAREYYTRNEIMNADYCKSRDVADLFDSDNVRSDCPDQVGADVSLALYVIYIIFINLIMVNLLIAIFSNKFLNIQKNANKIWKFERYNLVNEYFFKPILPPPFELFSFLIIFMKFLMRFFFNDWLKNAPSPSIKSIIFKFSQDKPFGFVSISENHMNEYRLLKWETYTAEEMLVKRQIETVTLEKTNEKLEKFDIKFEFINEKIKIIDHKLNKITNRKVPTTIDTLSPNLNTFDRSLSVQSTSLQSQIQNRLNNPPILLEEETEDESSNYFYRPPIKLNDIKTIETKPPLKSSSIQPKSYDLQPYTSRSVLLNYRADPDIMPNKSTRTIKFKFNEYDEAYEVDRKSCMGDYNVIDGLPICPLGKRNLIGRGTLFYWGPNHAIQAILTKFYHKNDKKILLFLVKKINDTNYRLPHIFHTNVEMFHNDLVDKLVEKLFKENSVKKNSKEYDLLNDLMSKPLKIGKYIPNSEMNTDNAWIEYTVMNYHDPDGSLFNKVEINNKKYEWVDANHLLNKMSTDVKTENYIKQIFNEYCSM